MLGVWGELASHKSSHVMSCVICVCVLYGYFGVCGYMLVVFIYLFLYLSIYVSTYGWYAMNYNFMVDPISERC